MKLANCWVEKNVNIFREKLGSRVVQLQVFFVVMKGHTIFFTFFKVVSGHTIQGYLRSHTDCFSVDLECKVTHTDCFSVDLKFKVTHTDCSKVCDLESD